MKLDKGGLVVRIDKAKCMNAKTFHETEGTWNSAIRHDPHDHVHAFRRQTDEVPEIVMGRLGLRKAAIRFLLDRMNHIRKANCVLNEENRNVVAHQIPVAFLRINFDRKSSDVACQVKRAFVARYRRKPNEGRRFFSCPLKEVRAGIFRKRLVCFEIAVCAIATSMDNTFRNALMVEMKDLFPEMKVLQDRRASRSDF